MWYVIGENIESFSMVDAPDAVQHLLSVGIFVLKIGTLRHYNRIWVWAKKRYTA